MTGTVAQIVNGNYPFAGMGADFTATGTYDITENVPGATGVVFNLKAVFTGAGLGISPPVRFMITDAATTQSDDGNGVNLTPVNGNWNAVTVFFNQMMTTGRSVSQTHVLDLTTAYQLQWEVTYPGANYDVSVDDVMFTTATPPAAAVPPNWPPALIDNCEQGSSSSLINSGRGGPWFTMGDNANNCPPNNWTYLNMATQDVIWPPNNGAPFIMSPGGDAISPNYCARITGTGMVSASPYPFPTLGLHFLPQIPNANAGCPLGTGNDALYDIDTSPGGPYTGFQFWAKVGAGSQTIVEVMGVDATTDPNIVSQQCSFMNPNNCDTMDWCNANHCYEINGLTTTWVQYQVPFTSIINPAWCTHNPQATFKTSQAVGIQWQFSSGAFDFSVDDVSFY